MRDGKIMFVDIKSGTIKIDPTRTKDAIPDRMTAIAQGHYAGMPCDMLVIMATPRDDKLFVVEDVA